MTTTHIADLSIDEFKNLIKKTVSKTIFDILRNSDEGLVLKESIEAQLRYSAANVEANGETVSAESVAAELGLEWMETDVHAQTVAETPSFLKTARKLNLQGPADWSERLEDYLYEGKIND